jgi:hypothetical protein
MSRSRATAKQAGTKFESDVVRYLRERLGDDRIERRAKSGAKDRGDIAGVRTALGERVVIEAKDVARLNLAGWVTEAATERGNDDAAVGLVVHKRRGYGPAAMGGTYVTTTLEDLVALLIGTNHTNGSTT